MGRQVQFVSVIVGRVIFAVAQLITAAALLITILTIHDIWQKSRVKNEDGEFVHKARYPHVYGVVSSLLTLQLVTFALGCWTIVSVSRKSCFAFLTSSVLAVVVTVATIKIPISIDGTHYTIRFWELSAGIFQLIGVCILFVTGQFSGYFNHNLRV